MTNLTKLAKMAESPFPNITAPMYLKGSCADMVKTVPCATPEKAPNGIRTMKIIQKFKPSGYWIAARNGIIKRMAVAPAKLITTR